MFLVGFTCLRNQMGAMSSSTSAGSTAHAARSACLGMSWCTQTSGDSGPLPISMRSGPLTTKGGQTAAQKKPMLKLVLSAQLEDRPRLARHPLLVPPRAALREGAGVEAENHWRERG